MCTLITRTIQSSMPKFGQDDDNVVDKQELGQRTLFK